MAVINRIAALADEMKEWRRHLHRHPELGFDCHETAAFVINRLKEFGVDEIHGNIARTGIVALIDGREKGPTIGLRADMDALPIKEMSGAPHASEVRGRMHACGHDGHTTMLLGAARYLAETRNFAGRVALIFQPAEEGGAGAHVMIEEGILERFGIERVFAIHNAPNESFGHFRTAPGPVMASVDGVAVRVTGKGGHAARPHVCVDPVTAIVAMVQALQTIVSRNVPAVAEAVLSITMIHAGTASNVIPDEGEFSITIRCFDPDIRDLLERRVHEIINGIAAAFGVTAEIDYERGYPATNNTAAEVELAAAAARDISGEAAVTTDHLREMVSEDFSYMLEKRPGAYLFLGTGPGAGLHDAAFDFNDEVAPVGASFLARLAEKALPVTAG